MDARHIEPKGGGAMLCCAGGRVGGVLSEGSLWAACLGLVGLDC